MSSSSNYYERQPFPHEDDASFERTLRNISTQEVMPRPVAFGSESMGRTNYDEFFGDSWHWDHLNLLNVLSMGSRFAISVAYMSALPFFESWIALKFTNLSPSVPFCSFSAFPQF